MRTFGFEKLTVWHKAKDLVLDTYRITRDFPREELYTLTQPYPHPPFFARVNPFFARVNPFFARVNYSLAKGKEAYLYKKLTFE